MLGKVPLKYLFQVGKCSCQHSVQAEQGWERFKFWLLISSTSICSWEYIYFLHTNASRTQPVSHPGKEKHFPAIPGLMAGTAHVGPQSSSLPAESSPSAPLLLSQHASDRGFGSSAIFNTAMFTACWFWNRVLPGLSTCLRDCCPHSPSLFLDRFQIQCCAPDLPQLKSHTDLFFPVTSFSCCCEKLLSAVFSLPVVPRSLVCFLIFQGNTFGLLPMLLLMLALWSSPKLICSFQVFHENSSILRFLSEFARDHKATHRELYCLIALSSKSLFSSYLF